MVGMRIPVMMPFAGGRLSLSLAKIRRPVALDVGQRRPDLFIAKNFTEARHTAHLSGARARLSTQLGRVEQMLVAVMPGVAGSVVGRRRVASIEQGGAPLGLPLELLPVAACAIRLIDSFTHSDLGRILRIGRACGDRLIRHVCTIGNRLSRLARQQGCGSQPDQYESMRPFDRDPGNPQNLSPARVRFFDLAPPSTSSALPAARHSKIQDCDGLTRICQVTANRLMFVPPEAS